MKDNFFHYEMEQYGGEDVFLKEGVTDSHRMAKMWILGVGSDAS